MMKISLIALSLFVSSTTLFAQDLNFGVKAGINVATLGNYPYDGTDWRIGWHAGLLSHIHVTPAFSLQPEIVYSSQGAKLSNYINNEEDLNLKLNYVNIPILLQYNFNNGFRLQGGPQVGFLTGVADKVGDNELNSVGTNDFNSIDFSIPLGVSYLAHSGLGADARYNIGITNTVKNSATKIRNSVFQFGVFYLLNHNHKTKTSVPTRRR